ncbi:hypothetical protein BgiMline_022502, partial [Biomphalaria glabrata]
LATCFVVQGHVFDHVVHHTGEMSLYSVATSCQVDPYTYKDCDIHAYHLHVCYADDMFFALFEGIVLDLAV